MVEIAIALAVIAFALVAIIGVLPSGMQVQRENREETIINHDGTYFMEAIRSGAMGLDELVNSVMEIEVWEADANGNPRRDPNNGNPILVKCPEKILSGTNIIGALSTPQFWAPIPDCAPPNSERRVYQTYARVRSMSGVVIEKGSLETITFEYLLTSEIVPFPLRPETAMVAFENRDPGVGTNIVQGLNNELYEVRLIFRWPLLADGSAGANRKVFRSLVSGSVETNAGGYFFRSGAYRATPPSIPPS